MCSWLLLSGLTGLGFSLLLSMARGRYFLLVSPSPLRFPALLLGSLGASAPGGLAVGRLTLVELGCSAAMAWDFYCICGPRILGLLRSTGGLFLCGVWATVLWSRLLLLFGLWISSGLVF